MDPSIYWAFQFVDMRWLQLSYYFFIFFQSICEIGAHFGKHRIAFEEGGESDNAELEDENALVGHRDEKVRNSMETSVREDGGIEKKWCSIWLKTRVRVTIVMFGSRYYALEFFQFSLAVKLKDHRTAGLAWVSWSTCIKEAAAFRLRILSKFSRLWK